MFVVNCTRKRGKCARLAQSVERQALNLVVGGSSPPVGVFYSRSSNRSQMTGHQYHEDYRSVTLLKEDSTKLPVGFWQNERVSLHKCSKGTGEATLRW